MRCLGEDLFGLGFGAFKKDNKRRCVVYLINAKRDYFAPIFLHID